MTWCNDAVLAWAVSGIARIFRPFCKPKLCCLSVLLGLQPRVILFSHTLFQYLILICADFNIKSQDVRHWSIVSWWQDAGSFADDWPYCIFHVYCRGLHEDHVHGVHLVLAQLPAHRVLARAVNNPSRSFTVPEEGLYYPVNLPYLNGQLANVCVLIDS